MKIQLTEEEQFNKYGDASRCLIKLAELQNKPISKEDFIKTFDDLFPEGMCGFLNAAELIEIAQTLGLCDTVISIRNVEVIKTLLANKQARGILFLTDLDQDGKDLFQTRLVLNMGPGDVLLFSPCESGEDFEYPYELEALEKELPHYLALL